ncbi:hypothetical protein TBR22_A04210 [Luteitalea sp. TBR-22]|uniref:TolC family protein n=1 Tax=Luteitalea sp. TBR-22 TaxID=2802971 RepID=UPI001AF52409|nr:TolC family protein [Luteitalea sp. TBR-22]BCS31221.1 hypothetical protein TBR22_A04210 [Luteitalea sp. TBR-22]
MSRIVAGATAVQARCRAWAWVLPALALVSGCAVKSSPALPAPADSLHQRTGVAMRTADDTAPGVPVGVDLADGLTADEAVALALWNNAAFQVSVSELGFARADLVEAGLLSNPVLSLLFPAGVKQFEATLRWPVEVLWERPRRVAMAQLALDVAGQRLVQTGLDLTASVRIAYADVSLATDRAALAREAADLLTRIDTLTQSRLKAGDISELEARAARVDATRGLQDVERADWDVVLAWNRLRLLLGVPDSTAPLVLGAPAARATCSPTSDLLREALVARPDVRAAELAVETAGARIGWEKSRILALTAVLDANGQGIDGFEMGPGIDASLPIFNRNQGGRARAEADLQRSSAAYVAIQQQVGFELREATTQFDQAHQSAAAWQERIVAPLRDNLADAERSFAQGEMSYLFVLENSRRLTDARVRARELEADQARAHARIERAVGRSCGRPPVKAPRGQ